MAIEHLDKTHNSTSFRKSLFQLILVSLIFYVFALVGLVSSADAFFFMMISALLLPTLRVPLLLISAAIQDAPGLSYTWSYALFAGLSVFVTVQYCSHSLIWGRNVKTDRFGSVVFYLWLLAIVVIAYAVAISWAQTNFDGFAQSTRRPYIAVGGLMMLMVTVGYISTQDALSRSHGLKLLGSAALIAATHSVLIGLIQIGFGPEFYRSSGNIERVLSAGQLTDAGALGIARINGPFLSPNAFGFSILICCLVAIVTVIDTWKNSVIRVFLLFGALAVVLSVSKALAAFYISLSLVLYWCLVSRSRLVVYLSLLLAGVMMFSSQQMSELLIAAFRIEGGLGARETAWSAVVENLNFADWVFGIGLAAWPPFFSQFAGFELSDPHTLVLSVPGTFGVAGVILYLCVTVLLAEKLLSWKTTDYTKVAVLGIFALLLGKDMVSIPALLGNTPFTYLVWLCLTMILLKPTTIAVSSHRV